MSPRTNVAPREAVPSPLDVFTSRTPAMEEVKRLIRQVAGSDITVLITGESGTGKELVARALHQLSRRRAGPLVALNCGAIPEGIFESEIFGHEKGSFTSAAERRRGYFEMAHRGTLFLDEIGEMPQAVQAKILRVLETGSFIRVGGSEEMTVDARVIAATNKDLGHEAERGAFRQDLYFRLKAVALALPPLRERPDDIPLLAQQFALDFAARNGRPTPQLDPEAMTLLKGHYWAGNVRELKNFVESLIALSAAPTITYADVVGRLQPASSSGNLPVVVRRPPDELDRELLYRTLLDLRGEMSAVKGLLQMLIESRSQEIGSHFAGAEEVETFTLDEMEREQIRRVLTEFGGNRRLTARKLGIGERTLYRKLLRYGLQ